MSIRIRLDSLSLPQRTLLVEQLKFEKKRTNFNHLVVKKLKKLQLPLEIKKKKSNYIIINNFKSLSVKKSVKILKNKILKNERSNT